MTCSTINFTKEFLNVKMTAKKTWKNDVTNRISNQSFPDSMIINQNKIIDKYCIANHLNNYFGSLGSKMSTCFKEDNVLFQKFLKNKINTVFLFHSVVEVDVSCKIKA